MLYGLFIRIATPLAFFAMHSWEIVALTTSDNRVRHIVSSQDDAVAGLLGRRSRLTENMEYSHLSSWLQTGSIQRDSLARKRQWRSYANGSTVGQTPQFIMMKLCRHGRPIQRHIISCLEAPGNFTVTLLHIATWQAFLCRKYYNPNNKKQMSMDIMCIVDSSCI